VSPCPIGSGLKAPPENRELIVGGGICCTAYSWYRLSWMISKTMVGGSIRNAITLVVLGLVIFCFQAAQSGSVVAFATRLTSPLGLFGLFCFCIGLYKARRVKKGDQSDRSLFTRHPSGSSPETRRILDSFAPGGNVYRWAARLSWWIGLFTALVLFALVPRWYFGVPIALLGFWLSTSASGASWAIIRGAFFWKREEGDDWRHLWLHRISLLVLLPAMSVGLAGLLYIPNWQDFQFNGHPSLVAVAGSVVIGGIAFAFGFGLTAWTLHSIATLLLGLRKIRLLNFKVTKRSSRERC
jgi:hypothetical protein